MAEQALLIVLLVSTIFTANAFHGPTAQRFLSKQIPRYRSTLLSSTPSWRPGDDEDANIWISSDEIAMDSSEWEATLEAKRDGSLWSSMEVPPEQTSYNGNQQQDSEGDLSLIDDELKQDEWLKTLAQLTAEEVEFNIREADRADKARQMQEWGFDANTITYTLDVATDTTLEDKDEVAGMQAYRDTVYNAAYLEDLEAIESHTKVEVDQETGEPIRSQMVYVDEHTCIGCTNCAMIARNTFFMQQDYGRARVYRQWGDDDETIQIAIETCPVDCIHYVPYDELKRLEIDRRGMNINFKARLVGASDLSHQVGGAVKFTPQQKISGNMAARCNNCPTRGCRNCPMYGVGKNPEFERKERIRKERIAKRKLEQERDQQKKRADL